MIRLIILLTAIVAPAGAQEPLDDRVSIGIGGAAVSGEICTQAFLATAELASRRWTAVLTTHGEGTCRGHRMRANIAAGMARTTWPTERLAVGIGAAVKRHGDMAVGGPADPGEINDRPQLTALLMARWWFRPRLSVDLVHLSTGGAAERNAGDNVLVISGSF